MSHDVSRRICPHCSKSVSFKTYKAHRRLFYDFSSDQWLTTNEDSVLSSERNVEEAQPCSFGQVCEQDDGSGMDPDSAPSHDFCKYRCCYKPVLDSGDVCCVYCIAVDENNIPEQDLVEGGMSEKLDVSSIQKALPCVMCHVQVATTNQPVHFYVTTPQ